MISRRGARRGLLGTVVAGCLVLTAAGCGGEGDAAERKTTGRTVAAGQLCGGGAVSAEAAGALEAITGSDRFEATGEESTVAAAARALTGRGTSSAAGNGDVCRIHAPEGTPEDELRITWQLSDSALEATPAPKFTVLEMGERTLAAPDSAYITFACRSGKLPGADPDRIEIGVEHGGMPREPEGDTGALEDAHVAVAHSFALAMAKELGCGKDGGLPARPSLDPA
ncbi:hypothetical protein [Streptomyces nitrosporeus]|uniref:hypothetical protein n=1 Tax=Streptomyces nitrosporeus TaxID=28894 RepID=UPI00167E15E5|nr:hypothetical protein [Streptomyces nitrosporeus]GGY97006.1 hypothetical protein GCM10010327_29630 [Streptomyces nitrosporeus]